MFGRDAAADGCGACAQLREPHGLGFVDVDLLEQTGIGIDATAELLIEMGDGDQAKGLVEIMEQNINKLRARFPERFNSDDAVARNLEREREILEN